MQPTPHSRVRTCVPLHRASHFSARYPASVQAAHPDDVWLFYDPNATITVLLPPRTHVNGLLYAFEKNALKASEVWQVVSLHVLPELVTSQDLVRGEGRLIPTLNTDGQQLRLSLSLSDTSGMGANSNAPAGTVGIIAADLDACNPSSTMHAIGSMLFPDDFLLPPEGQPRALDAGEGGAGSGGMSTGAIVGIAVVMIACFLSCILGATLYKRRVRKEAEAQAAAAAAAGKLGAEASGVPGKPYAAGLDAVLPVLEVQSASIQTSGAAGSRTGGSAAAQWGSDGGGVASSMGNTRGSTVRTRDGVGLTTFGLTAGGTQAAPAAGAPDEDVKAWVEYQLDCLGEVPVLQRFVMLGASERRTGGALSLRARVTRAAVRPVRMHACSAGTSAGGAPKALRLGAAISCRHAPHPGQLAGKAAVVSHGACCAVQGKRLCSSRAACGIAASTRSSSSSRGRRSRRSGASTPTRRSASCCRASRRCATTRMAACRICRAARCRRLW